MTVAAVTVSGVVGAAFARGTGEPTAVTPAIMDGCRVLTHPLLVPLMLIS